MTDIDPNSAYSLDTEPDASMSPPLWLVRENGKPVRWFGDREQAIAYASDPAIRAAVAAGEVPLHLRNPGIRMLVCGGRDYANAAHVCATLDRLHARRRIVALMQGGAPGADRLARDWAASRPEIQRFVCRADWDAHGAAAGPIRNARMLEWKPDLVLAFPGGRGTADMVRRARAAGVEVIKVP